MAGPDRERVADREIDELGIVAAAGRTSRGPDASQNAIPKRSVGAVPNSASWRSSTVLMKCALTEPPR